MSVPKFKQEEVIFYHHSFRSSHIVLATKIVHVVTVERSCSGKRTQATDKQRQSCYTKEAPTCKDGGPHLTRKRSWDQESSSPGWSGQDPQEELVFSSLDQNLSEDELDTHPWASMLLIDGRG